MKILRNLFKVVVCDITNDRYNGDVDYIDEDDVYPNFSPLEFEELHTATGDQSEEYK